MTTIPDHGLGVDALRNLSLAVPLLAVLAVVAVRRWRAVPVRRDEAATAGLAAGTVWLGVLAVERATDWWAFAPGPTDFGQVPLETSLGWALLWGALPALAGGRPVLWWAAFAWADLLLMPALEPLLRLGPRWWLGELLLLVVVLAPALLLAHATRTRTLLAARVLVQLVTAAALVLWLLPEVAFNHGPGGWAVLADRSWPARSALLTAAVVVAVPVLSAVQELARVGGGTPWPWDPPARLVTTGPYAYLRNPMQVGAVAALLLLALATGSPWLACAAGVVVAFFAVLAERHEGATLGRRWPEYAAYRSQVRAWVPRWRPHVPVPSSLWVSEECGLCRTAGEAVRTLAPTGLTVRPAEQAGVRLTRMRWVLDGPVPVVERGVVAFARTLEQVHLGAAWFGWLVRLPVVATVVRVVADACGFGPREAPRRQVASAR